MISRRRTDYSKSIDQQVGERLRTLMAKEGMTAEELARKLGQQPSHIDEFCAGTKRIGATLLMEISQIFDVKVTYFYTDGTEASDHG